MEPIVSVVIPTYKRNDLLKRCIDALLHQSFNEFEIIIVDDANSAATKCFVKSLTKKAPITISYLALPHHKGPAAARNLGWANADGDIIAFTDDDTIPDRNWLTEGIKQFSQYPSPTQSGSLSLRMKGKGKIEKANPPAAVTGRTIVPIPDNPTDYELTTKHLEDSAFITANCFIKRDVLRQIGGFDERFTMAWREDSDMQLRLLKNNIRIIKATRAIVIHPVRPAPFGISINEQKKAQFNALLYKKHKDLYWKFVQPYPPLHYYVILAALITVLISIITAHFVLALIAGIIGIGLLTDFFFKRIAKTKKTFGHIAEMLLTSLLIPFLAVYWRLYGAVKYRVLFI